MTGATEENAGTHLRYLNASKIESPVGVLSHLDVETVDGEPIGDLDGVLIDPDARCIRYYVVKPRRRLVRRRYLLAADQPAVLEPDRKALRFQIAEPGLQCLPEFKNDDIPEFSDNDLLSVMFAPR